MVKAFLNSLFFALVIGISAYIFWIGVERQNPCDNSLSNACTLLADSTCPTQTVSIWISVKSSCPFCSSMIRDISSLSFDGKIYLVASEPIEVLKPWVESLAKSPQIVVVGSVPQHTLGMIFCSQAVPVVLQFNHSQLIQRHEGFVSLSKWIR